MDNGWIKVHRKILDNPISNKPLWCWLWVYLVLRANHEDKYVLIDGKKELLKRGQFVTSLKTISKETGITIQIIRSVLVYLESNKQITNKSTNKYRIITINNYDHYQDKNNNLTDKKQTNNKQITTDKNIKNIKKIYIEEKSSKNSLIPCTSIELEEIARKLSIPISVVKTKHQVILNKIKAKEFKNKTVYLTLENWLLGDLEKGYLKKEGIEDHGYKKLN